MKHLTVRQHAAIQTGCNIVGVACALISFFADSYHQPALWLAIGFVVLGVVWRAIFIKCPHCGDGLTGSRSIPHNCPSCGKSLHENPTKES